MSSAVAFLAGMGAGYIQSKDKALNNKRQEAKDKQDKDLYDMKMAEMKQATDDRQALRDAGSPVSVQADAGPPTQEAMSKQDPLAPTQEAIGYTAGSGINARSYANKGVADSAAADQNTPDAARKRMASVYASQGNMLAADQLKTSGIQAEAGQMALDKGKREEANANFDQGIKSALQTGGPQGLADFMSKSQADGKGGEVKFEAVTGVDGKTWQMNMVGANGEKKPFGGTFAMDEGGYATAGMMLSRSVPDSEKVKHLLSEKEADRKAKHDDKSLAIQQQNADTSRQSANSQEQYRRDMISERKETREALKTGAQAAGAPPTWSKDADEHITKLNTFKDPKTGQEKIDGDGAIFMQQLALDAARKNGGNTLAGISRASQIDQQLRLEAKGSAEKLNQLRQQALAQAMAPKQAVPAPVVPAANAAAQASRGVVAPAAAPVAQTAAPAPAQQAQAAAPAIPAQHAQALKPLADAAAQAASVMAAVSKSGDVKAIQMYGAQLTAAKQALEQEAVKRLGPNVTQQFLSTLPY